MNKTYVLTFSISVLVLISLIIVLLMILIPQQSTVINSTLNKYESIKKSDYVYEQTKDISKDALVREYTITSEQMQTFKNNNQYVSGNSDPFTPYVEETEENNDSGSGTTSGSSSSTSTNDKITNSNGGTPNPPATSK